MFVSKTRGGEMQKELSKDALLALWDGCKVEAYTICLPLPTTPYPASFIGTSFGCASPEQLISEELFSEFSVYEDQHPSYKGQLVKWKVVRCEIYRGDESCAHKAMVICHCDRIGTP